MRRLLLLLLVFGVAGLAGAANLSNHNIIPDKGTFVGDNMADSREGGETFDTAVVIPSLPYDDMGATCDNIDDITLPCAASAAPDVVYRYTHTDPNVATINVALCYPAYDTALGIYDANQNNLACNDDFCGLQSEIDNIAVTLGQTYYFVVDGFSTQCGSYAISVTGLPPCEIVCPAGAVLEGEPPCGDNYYDSFNGGCTSAGFQVICPIPGTNEQVICGKSGTYLYDGYSYRDTDWFVVYGTGGHLSCTWRAAFPVQCMFIYGTNCDSYTYDFNSAGPCQDITLQRIVANDSAVWLFTGPSAFNGIPCETTYMMTITGIGLGPNGDCMGVATRTASWGSIKALYR